MKTLLFRPGTLALSLLIFAPCPTLAANQDADALSRNARIQAEQAMKKTNAKTIKTLQDIRASVQQLQRENQVRIQQLTGKIEALSEQTKQRALSVERQTGEGIRAATGRKTPEEADPYDSEEAQRKAEAALLRTGPTGPDITKIVPAASLIVISSDDIVALKSQMQENGATLRTDVVGLDQAISDLGAKVTKMAIVVDLQSDVLFDYDKAEIKPAAEQALAKVALIIRKKGTGRVLIDGHTDAKGSEAYNQKLSEQRAEAVKKWLVEQGSITEDRLVTNGYGETKPVAPNTFKDGSDNPEGRAKNRRVVITVSTTQ